MKVADRIGNSKVICKAYRVALLCSLCWCGTRHHLFVGISCVQKQPMPKYSASITKRRMFPWSNSPASSSTLRPPLQLALSLLAVAPTVAPTVARTMIAKTKTISKLPSTTNIVRLLVCSNPQRLLSSLANSVTGAESMASSSFPILTALPASVSAEF